MASLDKTWQMGLAIGIVLTVLTVGAVWLGARDATTMYLGIPVLGWVGLYAWLEKGLK
jgi:hypothetical protein